MSRRRSFTLVEVGVGMSIGVILFLVVYSLYLSGRRGAQQLRTSLEANEAVLRTFRILARDIRSAREVLYPPLAPPGTPRPDFSWTSKEQGTHRIDLEVYQLAFASGQLVPRTRRVVWYLDFPKPLSDGKQSYTLVRVESPFQDEPSGSPASPPPGGTGGVPPLPPDAGDPRRVADQVHELIFHRVEADPAAPAPYVGAENVMVRMTSSRTRRIKDGRKLPGYTAELETTVHLRGGR